MALQELLEPADNCVVTPASCRHLRRLALGQAADHHKHQLLLQRTDYPCESKNIRSGFGELSDGCLKAQQPRHEIGRRPHEMLSGQPGKLTAGYRVVNGVEVVTR